MSTATTSNTALVLAEIEALNARDFAHLREVWVPDGVARFPDRTMHGSDELVAYLTDVVAGIPDFKLTVLHTAEADDLVFVHWRADGTHQGRFQGVAPTGKRLSIDGMDQFTVAGDKISAVFVIFDQMDIGRQLGMLPPDGSAPDRAIKAAFNGVQAAKGRFSRG
jgi:predicted ester cyclase